jgi:hypothetical protein
MWRVNRFVTMWIVLVLTLTSCASTQPKCTIESLILDEKLLPEGTYAERLALAIPEKPKESASRSFYYAPYDIFHAVINWHSARAAKREFNNDIETAFDTDKYMGPWETPGNMFNSQIADNYHVACGTDRTYQCRLAATYAEYSVYFRADVGDEGITLLKVNEVLQAMDETMAQCIN